MKITRDNYELYLIDYMDGILSPADQRELQAFLLVHNDLTDLFSDTQQIKLRAPSIQYPFKSSLKKGIEYTGDCMENTCENIGEDINDNLKLIPDLTLCFEKKDKIYQKNPVVFYLKKTAYAAAMILLICGIWMLLMKDSRNILPFIYPDPLLAEMTKITVQPMPIIKKEGNIQLKRPHVPEKSIHQITPAKKNLPKKQNIDVMEIYPPILCKVIPENIKQKAPEINRISSPLTDPSLELILSEEAYQWMPSGSDFLSENIISSLIEVSKLLAEKIKNPDKKVNQ